MLKNLLPLLVATTLLSGCANTVYRTELEIYCPDLLDYSSDFNEKLILELELLPEDTAEDPSAIVVAISDYATLRQKIQNCIEERENANGN